VNFDPPSPASKVAFVSSTVYDLERERSLLRSVLEDFVGPVRFTALLSEDPAFPLTPLDLAEKHSYQICLDKIAEADYFLLLIKNRYGATNVPDGDDMISITHREYREAYRLRLPLFTFVDRRTWNARNRHKKGNVQRFVPSTQLRVFDLLDEITRQPRSMWLNIYRNPRDIRTVVERALFSFDDSVFVADVTIPDGTIVHANQTFEKIWEIRNNGCVIWENRRLQEDNTGASGLVPAEGRIEVPRTLPGSTVRLSVTFKAPPYPCTCESYWKMIGPDGRLLFPNKKGLYCRIKVVF
jgi:hypothetical protein